MCSLSGALIAYVDAVPVEKSTTVFPVCKSRACSAMFVYLKRMPCLFSFPNPADRLKLISEKERDFPKKNMKKEKSNTTLFVLLTKHHKPEQQCFPAGQ